MPFQCASIYYTITFVILNTRDRKMKLIAVLLSILLSSASSHSHENPFNSIAKEISGSNSTTTFTVSHVISLLEKIGFKNCSKTVQSESCQLCLESSELLNWYGYQNLSSFNKTQFESLFSGIVYMLTPINQGSVGAVCNRPFAAQRKNFTQKPFNSLLRQYGDGHGSLEEKQIDKLLEDVNTTLKFRLTKKPCFDVHDALKGAELSEAVKNAKELDKLSSYLILQLLEGHCIAEHVQKSSLPQPKEFIDLLFKEYGVNGRIPLPKFESLLKKLGIGNEPTTAATTDTDHSGHSHRKRRSVDTGLEWVISDQSHLRKRRAVATGNATGSVTGKCFTPENLLSIHSVNAAVGINETQFKDMCPSLVQQIESGACKTSTTKTSSKEEGWKPWVSAIVAVFILSLGSLAGIFFAPFSDKKSFNVILTFLIALAVATLLGDSILHLLPHSMGLHKHEEGSNHSHTSLTDKNSFVWKSLIFIVGVYVFYLFELYLHTLSKNRHVHGLEETHQHVGKGRTHSIVAGPGEIISERNGRDAAQKKDSGYIGAVCGLHKCEEEVCIDLKHVEESTLDTSVIISKMPLDEWSETPKEVYINQECAKEKKESHVMDQNSSSLELTKVSSNGHAKIHGANKTGEWKSVAWMVLVGDSIHNFLDGVAIGAAFTDKFPSGFLGGISTSIAIWCHELPHELGDFAILINAGLSIKLALLLNFLTSLTSVLGAIIGVALGQAMDASPWIFALAAGLFVYIALTDMVPELIHSSELRRSPLKTIIVQNVGLLIGFGVMVCLSVFEEDIKV